MFLRPEQKTEERPVGITEKEGLEIAKEQILKLIEKRARELFSANGRTEEEVEKLVQKTVKEIADSLGDLNTSGNGVQELAYWSIEDR